MGIRRDGGDQQNTPAPTRVLLVEDSEDDAELVRLELERAGLVLAWSRVDTADAMRAALEDHEWDVIISDFAMPGWSGIAAFELSRALSPDTPFIFVSGALGEERAVDAMRSGARDYLLKGNLTRLGEAVRREIRGAAGRRHRRIAEAAARQEARRLAMAVEASGAGIFEQRWPADETAYHGERWAEILGFTTQSLPPPTEVWRWFEDRIHEDDRTLVRKAWQAFIDGGERQLEIEARVAHRDGHWVWIALFAKAVERDPSGTVTHMVGVMLDTTAHRKLEEELRQAQKMEAVGRLAGGVAHDFNNLLTVIQNFGEFVFETLEGEARDDMREVLEAARRAASLTEQLLAFSRRQAIAPRVVDVAELIRGTERMLRRLLGEDIELVTHLAPDLGRIRVDPRAFEQVLMNLAINARDAMPAGGSLMIASANLDLLELPTGVELEVPSGRYVEVIVEDNGIGMSAETMARVFEPFFTTKPRGQGTGLGLSTCYGIIKQAQGFMSVDSELGRGTLFRVVLPRVMAPPEPIVDAPPPAMVEGSETILVVEDDEQVRRLVVRALSQLGYRVLEAESAVRAYDLWQRNKLIDLLVTDVVMPTVDGGQLAEALRIEMPDLAVLYMSGYTEDVIAHHGVLAPDTLLIHKPFTLEDLTYRVREALDRRR